jgi:hypothetical protein
MTRDERIAEIATGRTTNSPHSGMWISDADVQFLVSQLAEAKAHVAALMHEMKKYHNGKPVGICSVCQEIAAAQAWLDGEG